MDQDRRPARLPKNYRLVYDLIREAGTGVHLTTNDLFAMAKARQPAIGFTTVYRGIQRLVQLGLLDAIAVPGSDAVVYEPASSPHAHFRCDRCGSVLDVDYALAPSLIAELSERTGARIDAATLTLHGTCSTCR
ncbi:MAG: transcriptional repressor [Candidatus Eremiobacteraeota bacterium]|nr:transcriptional repressor [Candidatus Eremiobacteraeota bacterium]